MKITVAVAFQIVIALSQILYSISFSSTRNDFKTYYKRLISSSHRLQCTSTADQNIYTDLGIITGKLLDTAEDAILHIRRYFSPYYRVQNKPLNETQLDNKRPRVVVVGSGWAAHALLKIIEAEQFHVICISPRPYYVFTPMLSSTAVGTVEYRSIIEPIRASNPFVDYIEGEVTNINPQRSELTITSALQKGDLVSQLKVNNAPTASVTAGTISATSKQSLNSFNINYDYLVYAAGAQVADFGIPGVKEHCCFIKEIDDVRKIKNSILNTFELASLPNTPASLLASLLTFVVVGGGPTGVEFAGELSDFVRSEVARLYPRLYNLVRIVLLNSGSSILNAFDAALQEQALLALQSSGIDIRLNTRVLSVEEGKLIYKDVSANGSNGMSDQSTELTFGVCVWAAGVSPRPLTVLLSQQLGNATSVAFKSTGRLKVDPWMRVCGIDPTIKDSLGRIISGRILAVGDASNFPWTVSTRRTTYLMDGGIDDVENWNEWNSAMQEGTPLPQTAQVAGQQGAYIARLFNRGYNLTSICPEYDIEAYKSDPIARLRTRGKRVAKPFSFLNLGLLAYVGDSQAVAQVQLNKIPLVRTAGDRAYLLWRSVYLVKQVSARTRFLVLLDYIKTKLFGRDISGL